MADQPKIRQAEPVSTAVFTASASLLVATLLFILNQRAQIQQERRQARLARINSQLRELYGPLNALVEVNERLWEAMRESFLPGQAERRPGSGTPEWRRWRELALMPANLRMRDLIIEHADLVIDPTVPQELRDFCAHVASLEVALAAQQEGRSERALIKHPGAPYVSHVHDRFVSLKNEQHRLLKLVGHSTPPATPRLDPGAGTASPPQG